MRSINELHLRMDVLSRFKCSDKNKKRNYVVQNVWKLIHIRSETCLVQRERVASSICHCGWLKPFSPSTSEIEKDFVLSAQAAHHNKNTSHEQKHLILAVKLIQKATRSRTKKYKDENANLQNEIFKLDSRGLLRRIFERYYVLRNGRVCDKVQHR